MVRPGTHCGRLVEHHDPVHAVEVGENLGPLALRHDRAQRPLALAHREIRVERDEEHITQGPRGRSLDGTRGTQPAAPAGEIQPGKQVPWHIYRGFESARSRVSSANSTSPLGS